MNMLTIKARHRNKVIGICSAVILLLVFLSMFNPIIVYASATGTGTTEPITEDKLLQDPLISMTKQRVYDGAGFYTEAEEIELEEILHNKGREVSADIYIITTNTLDGKTNKVYLEDIQDELYFNEKTMADDAVLLLIEMEDRSMTLQGYGICEFQINNDRIEYIFDDLEVYLQAEDYYGAATAYADEIVYYMGNDTGVSYDYEEGQDYGESATDYSDYYGHEEGYHVTVESESALSNIGVQIVIAMVVSAIIVACLVHSNSVKMTADKRTYMDLQHSGILSQRDDYVHTTLTKVRKPEPAQTSGGFSGRSSGGGGVSSGGRSHSGGSRGF